MGFIPTSCLADRPTSNSIEINGIPISLTKISQETGIDLGYISRIFKGDSRGSTSTIRAIAAALGMPMEAFMDTLPDKRSKTPDIVLD